MPRFSYALLGALALHGLALLVRARPAFDATSALTKARALQPIELEEFPIEETSIDPALPAAPLATRSEPSLPSLHASRVALPSAKRASAEVETTPEAAGNAQAPAMPLVSGAAEAGDAQPRKIDFGLDGRFFLHDPGAVAQPGPPPASELGPRARKSTTQRQLEAALSADDVARGLARGNALLGSLSSAVRAEGPVRGEAIVRATVSADGSFGSVELIRGTAGEWSAVLAAFRELAARKHVRLPPGAKGLRVTFSVKAKVQRPSGKETRDTAIGTDNPSLAPGGLLPSGDFDLADLSGASQRLVYARVVSEEVL